MDEKREAQKYNMTVKDWVASVILGVLFIVQLILSVLFYNSAGLDVVLYGGWILLACAIVLFFSSNVLQKKGGVPDGKGFGHTTILVDSGIYALIRHPIYFSMILLILALVCLSQHWFSALASIPMIIWMYWIMMIEEKVTLARFGDSYTRYMKNVPRINLVLGIYRWVRRQRRK